MANPVSLPLGGDTHQVDLLQFCMRELARFPASHVFATPRSASIVYPDGVQPQSRLVPQAVLSRMRALGYLVVGEYACIYVLADELPEEYALIRTQAQLAR